MGRNFLQVFAAKTYDQTGSQNPLFKRGKRFKQKSVKFFIAGFVLFILGLLGWLVFGRALRFTAVNIEGTVTLEQASVKAAVEEELARRVFVFPRDHRWFWSENNIKNRLQADFPLKDINVTRLGNELRIVIIEDVTLLILRSGDAIAFLDRTGHILRLADPLEAVAVKTRLGEITPSAEEQGSLPALPSALPIIRTVHPLSLDIGTALFAEQVMNNLIAMDNGLQHQGIIVSEYLSETVEESWFRVTSDLPYEIYFDANNDIEEQLLLLQTVMKQFETDPPLHYIDVRFGDRVFVR